MKTKTLYLKESTIEAYDSLADKPGVKTELAKKGTSAAGKLALYREALEFALPHMQRKYAKLNDSQDV